MPDLARLKQKRKELLNYLEQLRNYKAKTIKFVDNLELKYYNKEFSKAEFLYKLNKSLKGKPLQDWVSYYNKLMSYYNSELSKVNNEIKDNENIGLNAKTILIILIFLIISISAVILFKPQVTGFVIYLPGAIINETVTLSISNITVENATVTAKLNDQEVSLPLNEFNILEGLVNINLEKFNIKAEEGTLFVLIIYDNNIVVTTSLDIALEKPQENITLPPIEDITLPENITLPNITSKLQVLKQKIERGRIIIKDFELVNNKYNIKIEFNEEVIGRIIATQQSKGSIEINGLVDINGLQDIRTGKLVNNKLTNGRINTEIIAINPILIDNATITLPKDGNVNSVMKCNDFNFNTFTCNNWIKTNIPFSDNGTHIIFNVDSFSAYAGAEIVITKARHLDANRNFISDIYNEVKSLDNVWSETIPASDYVRVTFERELTPNNDITLYPIIVSGNPRIGVYEIDGNNLIAEFTSINSNEYNKVFLTNLNKSRDTFDLLILDGELQFDHIVDPTAVSNPLYINFTAPTPSNATTINRTTQFINITLNASQFDTFIFNWNQTNYTIYNNDTILLLNLNNNTNIREGTANTTRVIDISNYNNTGSCLGSGTSCNWSNLGRWGTSIKFDGNNDYVEIKNSSSLSFRNKNITISAWVNVTDIANGERTVIMKPFSATAHTTPFFSYDISICRANICFPGGSNGQVQFWLTLGGTFVKTGSATQVITQSKWAHIVGTYDGANMKVYLNGTLIGTNAQTGSITDYGNPVRLGVNGEKGEPFVGQIDEVMIINRSLSADEVYQLYISNLYKYTATDWNYITNQTNLTNGLANGTYTYYGFIGNSTLSNMTEIRTLCVNTSGGTPNDCTISAPSNNAPIFSTSYPQINSTTGTNQTNADLHATFVATDSDASDNTLRYNITYYTNNNTNFSLNNIYYTSGNMKVEALNKNNLTVGQTWKAQINLFDNNTNVWANTSELLILAAPNNPTNLIINSTTSAQLNLTTEDLRMNFLCDDPDTSDTLTFHLTAFKNYVNQFQLQSSCNDPEYKSVLLGNLNTTKFDNWSFSVNVSDAANAYSATISTNVNLTIRNSLPIIGNVTLDESDNLNLVEAGNKTFRFSFLATDADNFTDINNLSGVVNITRTGETTRTNDTFVVPTDGGCNAINNYGANSKNFSCTINIVFYDGAGTWSISVRINDTDTFAQNVTQTFSINELTAIQILPNSITFPTVASGDTNVSALNNITITNTGNDDISGKEATGETINITAITLVPDTGNTFIPVSNFTIGQVNASGSFNGNYCDQSITLNVTRLRNVTDAPGYSNFTGAINGSAVLAQAVGNVHTIGICLMHVPNDLAASQNYSTTKSGAWTIAIFFFRRKKNKIYEKNKDIINSLIEIKIFNNLDNNDLIKLINYEKELILTPISIFKDNSPLESLVKYLKDNLGLSLTEIASLLNRDHRTIWVTYHNASKKITELDVSSKIIIPINIFANRKLSILENLVNYLYNKGISLKDIAKLLNRDYKTIWTVYKRAKDKIDDINISLGVHSNIYK